MHCKPTAHFCLPHALLSPSVPATTGAYNAHACTSGSYNDPKGYMSFRLFDLPSTYFNNLAYVPPNIRMQLLPVAGDQWSSLGRTTRVKNGFVCLSSSENILRAMMEVAAPGLRLNVDSWPGGCGDGECHQPCGRVCLFMLYRHCSNARSMPAHCPVNGRMRRGCDDIAGVVQHCWWNMAGATNDSARLAWRARRRQFNACCLFSSPGQRQ